MIQLLEIIFYTLLLLFSFAVLVGSFLPTKNTTNKNDKIKLSELTLVVAYRNEKKRILPLIQSLNSQIVLPRVIVFVDDHSTDQTAQFLKDNLVNLSCEIIFLSLPKKKEGKKEAVFYGVNHAKTKLVHTMDADVFFKNTFFSSLEKLNEAAMLVLPVNMVGANFMGTLFALEHSSFQLMQLAFGKRKALMASGANLVFNRKKYLDCNPIEEHKKFASGDDQFALNAFFKANFKVSTILSNHFSVCTPAPKTSKALFKQRLRWMSKNNALFEFKGFLLSLWVFVIQILFLICALSLLISHKYVHFSVLLMMKMLFEIMQFTPVLKLKNQLYLLGITPVLTFFYPFYLLILFVSSFFYKPTWKDREIMSNKN